MSWLARLRALWWRYNHEPFDWYYQMPELREPSHVRITRYPRSSTLRRR